jgi:GT2 family glycosyltransferase
MNFVLIFAKESSTKNIIKNFVFIEKKALHLTKILISGESKIKKILVWILNRYLNLKQINFDLKENGLYVYAKNNCYIDFNSEFINFFLDQSCDILYGDSVVDFKGGKWYEARPRLSIELLKAIDYFGDVIVTRINFGKDFPFRKLLLADQLDTYAIKNLTKSLSNRQGQFSIISQAPILYDSNEDKLHLEPELNVVPARLIPISVIIPTAFKIDGKFSLQNCIDNLIAAFKNHEIEILVLFHEDNFKKFPILDLRLDNRLRIKKISYNYNFNFSKVVNSGIKEAEFETIIIMNDDVLLDCKFDSQHLFSHLDSDRKFGTIGAVGIKLLDLDSNIVHAGIEYNSGEPRHFLNGTPSNQLKHIHNVCREVSGLTGAFLLTTKSILELVGSFNENFPLDYNDVDLMLRLEKSNMKIIFCSKCTGFHNESMTRGESSLSTLKMELQKLVKLHGKLSERDPYLYTPAVRI